MEFIKKFLKGKTPEDLAKELQAAKKKRLYEEGKTILHTKLAQEKQRIAKAKAKRSGNPSSGFSASGFFTNAANVSLVGNQKTPIKKAEKFVRQAGMPSLVQGEKASKQRYRL